MMVRIPKIILCPLLSWLLFNCAPEQQSKKSSSVSDALSSQQNLEGFARAIDVRQFIFPQDNGPHPEFKTEWWYYTGNLDSSEGRHFGFQLTFFRSALTPQTVTRSSKWATNQVYFAHFALSNIQDQSFVSAERWSRGAAGLAGAQINPFKVWLEDWKIEEQGQDVQLKAKYQDVDLELTLKPLKERVFQGNKGLSQKSSQKGNASYYFSQSRLDSQGQITLKNKVFPVKGLSWLDREWSTSALNRKQEGWDWFALQLDDGRELMLYQLRLKEGGVDSFSSGSLILKDGQKIHLKQSDFSIHPIATWKSPHTGTIYPSGWMIEIPDYQLKLSVIPWQQDQELQDVTFKYWEGAVKIEGEGVKGNGYVELTGYDGNSK